MMTMALQKTDKYAALRYRDFRLLWLGLLVSNIGSQMQFAAVNWHIYELTKSAVALGLIGLSRFVPIVVFSLVAGLVADAHNRKKLLLITQVMMALFSTILAIATLTGNETPGLIYVITACVATAFCFDIPPRQALIPSLVKKHHLENALSLNVIMWQTAYMTGPALAGILIGKIGVGGIYVINAVSFVAVIAALLSMKTSGEINGEPAKVSIGSIIEGLQFVKSKTVIWSTMLLDFFGRFFSSATALLPIYAQDILQIGPVGYGLLYSAPAIGAVISGTLIAHKGTIKRQGRVLLMAIALYGIATIIFGISRFFWLSFFGLFLIGVGDSISAIIRNTIRQFHTPDQLRGRMISINMVFFQGGPQLGEFEAGLLAHAFGASTSVVLGGLGTLAVVGIVALMVPSLRIYTNSLTKDA